MSRPTYRTQLLHHDSSTRKQQIKNNFTKQTAHHYSYWHDYSYISSHDTYGYKYAPAIFMAGQPTSPNVTPPEIRPYWGLIDHWFPFIWPAIKPSFLSTTCHCRFQTWHQTAFQDWDISVKRDRTKIHQITHVRKGVCTHILHMI